MNLYESIKNNLKEDNVYVNDTKVVGNGGVHTGVLKSIVDKNKSKISDILSNWNINSISYQQNVDSDMSYGGVIIDATNKQDSRYTSVTTFWLMLEANDSCFMDCYQVLEFTNGDDFESLIDDDSIHQLISDETLGMRELVAKIEDTLLSLIKKVYSDFDDIISYRAKNVLNESASDFDVLKFEKSIPHHMRFKYHDLVPVNDSYGREMGQSLYWVTQEPFDDLDIERFRDAFVDTGFSDAYVTVRDLSNYDFNSDKDEGVLVHITKDGKIDADDYLAKADARGWFNESEELIESGKFNIYLAEIGYNGVVGTCRGIGKTEQEAKENAFKLFKQSYPRELEDATYNALKNQGHLRDTDTETDLWQKLTNIVPGSSGNDGTGTFVDEELMKYVDDWYGINIFDMSSGASNEGGGSLNESEKLNEGAQSFARFGEGSSAREVFNKLVDEAYYEYGHDPYNGTISTTNFGGSVVKIADTYSKEADAKAREYIENDDNGEKWVSKCLDLGELPDQPGVHRYVFYGWAAI